MYQPHEQRMIEELKELSERAASLQVFINTNPLAKKLPSEDLDIMCVQLDAMKAYQTALEFRINKFKERYK